MNPAPFRAAVVREFRQHRLWASMAGVALAATLAFLLYESRDTHRSMTSDLFVTGTMLSFAGLGLALGLAVLLGDLRRGHWAFLVHRPLSRGRLFAAKFAAAALMYGMATSLAIGVATLFALSPRFVRAPFSFDLLLPTIYFQLCGLAWLAAGLLVAVRQASWVGSRLYPFALPFLAMLIAYGLGLPFAAAAGVMAVVTALLAFSGANYFAANGTYEPQPRWARPLAFTSIFAAVLIFVTTTSDQAFGFLHDTFGPEAPSQLRSTNYALDSYGRPYQWSYFTNGTIRETTLDGRPVPREDQLRDLSRQTVGGTLLVADNPYDPDPARRAAARRAFLQSDEAGSASADDRHGNSWTFVATRRALEVYAYDGTYLGGFGPSGYYDARATPERFPPTARVAEVRFNSFETTLIVTNTQAWYVDITHRLVRAFFQTQEDEPILAADAQARFFGGVGDLPSALAFVLTPRHVYAVPVLMPYTAVLREPSNPWSTPEFLGTPRSVEIPPVHVGTRVSVAAFGTDGLAALFDTLPGSTMHPTLVRTLGGKVTRQELPALPVPLSPTAMSDRASFAVVLPLPLVPLTRWARVAPLSAWWRVLIAPVVAVVWSLLIARRRRVDGRTTVAWVELSAVLGIATPITLLFLREQPAYVLCPACGKVRRVDRERCDYCGASFPPPGDAATAVFEDDDAVAA